MEYRESLLALLADPSSTGIFCDFDGTLSEIVDLPDVALPVPGALEVLTRLVSRFAVVGIISGRPQAFLQRVLPVDGLLLAGSYGRELPGGGPPPIRVMDLVSGLPGGVEVELKPYGFALHYRRAPDAAPEVNRIARGIAVSEGFEISHGRMVVELLKPGPGKGDTLQRLVAEKHLTAFCIAGDDAADVEAFARADQLAARSVVIAVDSAEAPECLTQNADVVVDGPAGLVELLGSLGGDRA